MIRGIFFDAAGVLYSRGGLTETFALGMLQALGFATVPDAQDLERQKVMRSQASQGQVSHAAYWDEFLRMRGVAGPERRQAMIGQITDYSNDVIPTPGNRDALAGLKQRGFVLGIVTDTMYPLEWKMRRLEKAGVAEFIDVVACSIVLGIHKPDPAMYLNALQQARLTPGESAFVGHSTVELQGARQAGLATVAVNHDADAQADYYCLALLDLLNVPIFYNRALGDAQTMKHDIQAIFLDVGNTLRIVVDDAPFAAQARQQLVALVGTHETEEAFFARLDAQWKAYRKWSFDNLTEASEKELWTRFMLPDFPPQTIGPLAGKLTRLWRDKDGRRIPRHDVKTTVLELSRRGYTLGIIANTITETEIPDWLEADGLTDCFKAVVLSSKVGYRKPGPEIYWEAAKRIGIEPACCAYVGDNPIRDVQGTRKAGFAMTIILPEPGKLDQEPLGAETKPDAIIDEIGDLLNIFPAR